MPTVPRNNVVSLRGDMPVPSDTDLMMALSVMKDRGKIVPREDIPEGSDLQATGIAPGSGISGGKSEPSSAKPPERWPHDEDELEPIRKKIEELQDVLTDVTGFKKIEGIKSAIKEGLIMWGKSEAKGGRREMGKSE